MNEFSNLYEQSLAWVNMGIAVIPCKEKSKIPYSVWKGYQRELPGLNDLKKWFYPGKRSLLNMGIVTGWRGLIVIDFDDMEIFQTWIKLFDSVNTLIVATSRGAHVYFYCNEPVEAGPVPGVGDIKANGGYVLSPGSIHPNNTEYKILTDNSIQSINRLDDVFPFSRPKIRANFNFESCNVETTYKTSNDPWETAGNPLYNDLLKAIKRTFPIIRLFPDAIRKGKNWYVARCPLHDDHNPSMWIDTRRNLCGCHAGCNNGKALDVINLYSQINNVSNQESIDCFRRSL